MEDRARFHLECETNLFGAIADIHDVTVEDALTARGRLGDKGLDPWVNLPMAALYLFVAIGATRRIRSRFPPDERWAAIVTTCFVSFVVSAILLMLGSLWSGAFEVVRVGNEHLSYRAFRSSWRQHWLEWFVVGVLLVWSIALVRYRLTRQEGSLDEHEAAP